MPIARWSCLAFLVGIGLHSFWLLPTGPLYSSVTVIILILLLILPERRIRILALIILSIGIGWVRFEFALPSLSPALRPLDPKAFAYKRGAPQDMFAGQRAMLTERILKIFPGDPGQLLAGMLYGERGLSNQSKQAFRQAGLTHLVAVSGSNVSIIVSAVTAVLGWFGWSRRRSFGWLSAVIITFVLFVTPQAPVVRAAIMGWLVAFAPIVGRLPRASHLLIVSAALFTLWQPSSLLFDPSFALSFLATLGLMTFGAKLSSALEGKMPEAIREALCSTVGATLLTTPYAMWAFGQASAVGLIANMFAVPLVPWIMGLGALAMVVPIDPLIMSASGFLQAALLVADIATKLPGYWGKLEVSASFLIFSYVSLAIYWWYLKQKQAYPQKSVRRAHVVRQKRHTK
ncbi:MAG: ComEC/Rec2 family competence protein [Candidatus Uhrbacteria bacterium]